MKKNKFTPGPWVVDADGFIIQRDTNDTGNYVYPLAKVFNENSHNAALIIAAPTLLALLTDIEAHLSGRAALHSGSMIFEEDAPALEIIRKAINQARGK